MKRLITITILCVLILCGCDSANEKTYVEITEKNTVEQTIQQPAPEKEIEDSLQKSKQEKEENLSQTHEETTEEKNMPEKIDTVSLIVDCSDILDDIGSLKAEKQSFIPDDGIMLSVPDAEFTDGESVFDVLKRELTTHNIHMEFNLSPVINNAYIEGIGNIYEFDYGGRSGWKYSVNGVFPPVGCSDYKVEAGDIIEFVYKIKAY